MISERYWMLDCTPVSCLFATSLHTPGSHFVDGIVLGQLNRLVISGIRQTAGRMMKTQWYGVEYSCSVCMSLFKVRLSSLICFPPVEFSTLRVGYGSCVLPGNCPVDGIGMCISSQPN